MADMDFTPLERRILAASSNPHVTVRRRRLIVITGLGLVAMILYAATIPLSGAFFAYAFAAYVVVTLIEKVSYANAVLAYKSVIRKLVGDAQRPDAPDA